MDLSEVVVYDDLITVEIKHRVTGEPVGVTMWVSSFEGNDPMIAERALISAKMRAALADMKDGRKPSEAIDYANVEHASDVERAIAAVKKWEWGENTFGNLGQNPELSDETKRYVFTHPNAAWIVAQVIAKGKDIANFIKA